MLTEVDTRTKAGSGAHRERSVPVSWEGPPPDKPVAVHLAITNLDCWNRGAAAIITYHGVKFRITREELGETARGILVGE